MKNRGFKKRLTALGAAVCLLTTHAATYAATSATSATSVTSVEKMYDIEIEYIAKDSSLKLEGSSVDKAAGVLNIAVADFETDISAKLTTDTDEKIVFKTFETSSAGAIDETIGLPKNMTENVRCAYELFDGKTVRRGIVMTYAYGALDDAVAAVNSGDDVAAKLSASVLNDGTLSVENVRKAAEYIVKVKGNSGYTAATLVTAYMCAEGFLRVKAGEITAADFAEQYCMYTGNDIWKSFDSQTDAVKAAFANAIGSFTLGATTDVRKVFDELLIVAKCIGAADAKELKSEVITYLTAEGYNLSTYNDLDDDAKDAVFDGMFENRKSVTSANSVKTLFASCLPKQDGGNGGIGGGGGKLPAKDDDVEENPTDEPSNEENNGEESNGGIGGGDFSDMTNHWAADYANALYQKGIVGGFPDGSFKPENNITRAEFAKMAASALGLELNGKSLYSDVSKDSWYYAFVAAATEAGLVNGSGNLFMPENNITRQDAAVIIARALKYKGVSLSDSKESFSDADDIADYAKEAVSALSALGIITGDNGEFRPKDSLTRAETCALFVRFLEYTEKNVSGVFAAYSSLPSKFKIVELPVRLASLDLEGLDFGSGFDFDSESESEPETADISPLSLRASSAKDSIGMKSSAGDRTYFDNRYCDTTRGIGVYQGVTFTTKTDSNKITTNRLNNLKDAHRTDEIHFEKNDKDNDCYMDVSLAKNNNGYTYYKMEGDVKVDKLGAAIQFPMIRETANNTYKGTAYPFTITTGGSIKFSGGEKKNAVTEGEWFHFLAYFDTKAHTASAWLDGELIADKISFTSDIDKINVMRISLASGEGDLWLDNFNITALEKPFDENGKEVYSFVMPSEEPVEDFLADKIAYGAYGNILSVGGEKIELEVKGEYDAENVRFYVPAETLARAFDLNLTSGNGKIGGDIEVSADGKVTLKNGTMFTLSDKVIDRDGELLVPFEELGEKISGLKAWAMKTGIIVFADHKLNFDSEKDWSYPVFRGISNYNDLDWLTSYLNYVHPDAERLKSDYSKQFGSVTSTQHPRLVLDADDFAEHKRHYEAQDDAYYNKVSARIITLADNYIKNNSYATYTFATGDPVRGSFYGFKERFMVWGYAWNLTGDQKYVDAAVKQFEIICDDMPDFNEPHTLDPGQAMQGVAIGYDWFYNAFTTEQREKYAKMIYDKGISRMGNGLYGRLTQGAFGTDNARYFSYRTNINGIINAGVEEACIAVMEYYPEKCMQMLSDSIRSIEAPLTLLAPSGGWVESPSYWNYMMTSLVWGTAAIETAFGTDYGLMDGQGASTTIESMLACFGNKVGNNYGDNSITGLRSFSTFAYFGKRNSDRAAIYSRKHDVERRGTSAIEYNDAVFYDFSNNDVSGSDLGDMGNMVKVDGVELVTIRDTFDFDDSKMFFSTHFGTTSGYHQHNDCGTFVLEMMGESWVEDLGGDDYNLQNVDGHKEWELYRYRAEGHSVMVINPEGHTTEHQMLQGKVAPIIASDANENGGYVYADMDDVYAEASKMTLGYYVDDSMNSVTMRNEYTLTADNDVYWMIQTPANATVDGKTVYLEKNGKKLKMEFVSSTNDGEWTVTDAVPFDFSPQVSTQNQNRGYKRVALKVGGKQGANTLIVKMSNADVKTKPIEDKTFSEWSVPKNGLAEYDFEEKTRNESNTSVTVYRNTEKEADVYLAATYWKDNRYVRKSFTPVEIASCGLSGDYTVDCTGDDFDRVEISLVKVEGGSVVALGGKVSKRLFTAVRKENE